MTSIFVGSHSIDALRVMGILHVQHGLNNAHLRVEGWETDTRATVTLMCEGVETYPFTWDTVDPNGPFYGTGDTAELVSVHENAPRPDGPIDRPTMKELGITDEAGVAFEIAAQALAEHITRRILPGIGGGLPSFLTEPGGYLDHFGTSDEFFGTADPTDAQHAVARRAFDILGHVEEVPAP